jgi:NAD-dependent deacetylase
VGAVARLVALIKAHQPCIVLTGAGVSTESGIPDFRSPTGIWATVDPREYASLSAFRRDPEKVWSFYALRLEMLAAAEPNRAHRALAELERRGLVGALVTQNIDMLHERAGSQDVIEVHGSIRTSSCRRCGATYPLAQVRRLIADGDGVPRCVSCATVLKPDVVFFEEMLPERAIDGAFARARAARLLLVVGTSLGVYPVAELPSETLAAGGKVAIVNRGPTPFDAAAALTIDGPASDVLAAVVSSLAGDALPVSFSQEGG